MSPGGKINFGKKIQKVAEFSTRFFMSAMDFSYAQKMLSCNSSNPKLGPKTRRKLPPSRLLHPQTRTRSNTWETDVWVVPPADPPATDVMGHVT